MLMFSWRNSIRLWRDATPFSDRLLAAMLYDDLCRFISSIHLPDSDHHQHHHQQRDKREKIILGPLEDLCPQEKHD